MPREIRTVGGAKVSEWGDDPSPSRSWQGRALAAAAGAGLMLAAMALRDVVPGRRRKAPGLPATWRQRLAARLRGE